ncbi:MAG TPA: twin-arginine translocase TatA/TatE family subunit [Stellaceae bacterium]|nr:twin-arginine translocase TatA/TatE family subunit [Stellaceae bacterium]
MGGLSIWHWLVVLGIGALVFGGKGKLSSVMGDFAKGIKAFKAGMKDEDVTEAPPQVPPPGAATTASASVAGAGERPAHERG